MFKWYTLLTRTNALKRAGGGSSAKPWAQNLGFRFTNNLWPISNCILTRQHPS